MIRNFVLVLWVLFVVACALDGTKSEERAQKRKAVNLYIQLGLGYLRQGQVDIAITKFDRALNINSKSVAAHTAMAMAHTHNRRFYLAEEYFKKSVKYGPKDVSANYNYGVYLCGNKKIKKGLKRFEITLRNPKNKTPEKTYLEMGKCALNDNNKQKAEYYYLQALQRNRRMPEALLEMTKLHYSNQNYQKAENYFAVLFDTGVYGPNSLWLGIQVERKLSNKRRERYYIDALKKRFPDSKIANEISGSKSNSSTGTNIIDRRKEFEGTKQDRMMKIDQLIEKHPLNDSMPTHPSRTINTPPAKPQQQSELQPLNQPDLNQIDLLIEERKRMQQPKVNSNIQKKTPSNESVQTDSGGDFMDLMK